MHLGFGQVAGHLHTVADAVEAAAEGIHVMLVAVVLEVDDGEFHAVGVVDLAGQVMPVVKGFLCGLLHAVVGLVDVLAPQHRRIAGVDQQQAPSAGVHHTRLLQRGQHVRRALEDRLAALEDNGHQRIVIVWILLRLLHSILGNDAGHGQDGALLGLHHSLVGHFRALLQRLGELHGGDLLHAAQGLGKAAEQLGGNHAGVAPRAAQRALGQGVGRLVSAQEFLAADLSSGALHGQGHIGARVAVRHRENVQGVHSLAVFLQQSSARNDHIAQQKAVNRLKLYQRSKPPFNVTVCRVCQMRIPSTEMFTLRTFTPVMLSSL